MVIWRFIPTAAPARRAGRPLRRRLRVLCLLGVVVLLTACPKSPPSSTGQGEDEGDAAPPIEGRVGRTP